MPTPSVPVATPEAPMPPTKNGAARPIYTVTPAHPSGGVDPAIALLVEEVRRGQDALKDSIDMGFRDLRGDMQDLRGEVRGLRDQAPGRFATYALASVMILALVALFALVATRGVDVSKVAEAVHAVAPVAPTAP